MIEIIGEFIFEAAIPLSVVAGLMLVLAILNPMGRRLFPKVHPYVIAVAAGALVAVVIMALALRGTQTRL